MDNRLAGLGRTFRPFPSLAGRGKKAGLGTAARLRKIEDFSKASPKLGTFFLKGRGVVLFTLICGEGKKI